MSDEDELYLRLEVGNWVLLMSPMCDWAIYRIDRTLEQVGKGSYLLTAKERITAEFFNPPIASGGCELIVDFMLIKEYLVTVITSENTIRIVSEQMNSIKMEFDKSISRLSSVILNDELYDKGLREAQEHARLLVKLLT